MKFKMALAAIALMLMGVSAQAQLSVVLDQGDPTHPINVADGTSPGIVTFGGTIFNIGTTTLELVGDSLSAPAGVGKDTPMSDFDLGLFGTGFSLAPGASLRSDILFGLDIPAGMGSFGGTYAVLTPDPSNPNNTIIHETEYLVSIQQAAVPEPGTMALLVSGLVGGSLFLVRRRK